MEVLKKKPNNLDDANDSTEIIIEMYDRLHKAAETNDFISYDATLENMQIVVTKLESFQPIDPNTIDTMMLAHKQIEILKNVAEECKTLSLKYPNAIFVVDPEPTEEDKSIYLNCRDSCYEEIVLFSYLPKYIKEIREEADQKMYKIRNSMIQRDEKKRLMRQNRKIYSEIQNMQTIQLELAAHRKTIVQLKNRYSRQDLAKYARNEIDISCRILVHEITRSKIQQDIDLVLTEQNLI